MVKAKQKQQSIPSRGGEPPLVRSSEKDPIIGQYIDERASSIIRTLEGIMSKPVFLFKRTPLHILPQAVCPVCCATVYECAICYTDLYRYEVVGCARLVHICSDCLKEMEGKQCEDQKTNLILSE